MNILAIDIGTRSGWAMRYGSNNGAVAVMYSGTWNLKGSKHEGGGQRFLRFHSLLRHYLDSHTVDQVVYELVARHAGTTAAHIYGGLQAALMVVCDQEGVNYTTLPVATIKKFATGKGNAGKPAMIAAANAKWPGLNLSDDNDIDHNEADARWIAECAAKVIL